MTAIQTYKSDDGRFSIGEFYGSSVRYARPQLFSRRNTRTAMTERKRFTGSPTVGVEDALGPLWSGPSLTEVRRPHALKRRA
jgi:hypothetical protein